MSSIVFVRHAQASFFSEDYDKLSEHGERQAELLGKFWGAQGKQFSEVVVGPCRRHHQTAEIALAASGHSELEIIELAEFDEHQVDQFVIQHRQSAAMEFPEIQKFVDAYENSGQRHEQAKSFQQLFEAMSRLWMLGRISRPDIEPWVDFHTRVNQGISHIVSGQEGRQTSGRRVAVFSSVGPISIAFQRATGCSDETAISTGWRLRNCSTNQILFSAGRYTLDSFNTLSHLPSQSDWTYR